MQEPKRNLKGQRYGYLAPYEFLGNGRWDCICTRCNKHVLKRQSDLELGKSRMCDACSLETIRRGR